MGKEILREYVPVKRIYTRIAELKSVYKTCADLNTSTPVHLLDEITECEKLMFAWGVKYLGFTEEEKLRNYEISIKEVVDIINQYGIDIELVETVLSLFIIERKTYTCYMDGILEIKEKYLQ